MSTQQQTSYKVDLRRDIKNLARLCNFISMESISQMVIDGWSFEDILEADAMVRADLERDIDYMED